MRIVFFGIYKIGVDSLHSMLRCDLDLVAVVTKPSTVTDNQPVAQCAVENGLFLLQPNSPKEEKFNNIIKDLRPDLIVVAGYHKIIPTTILNIPTWGTINLHGSLLPKYRGPCTWKWTIINGETFTGVSVHIMTPQLDNGDLLGQRVIQISDTDTGGSLFEKISVVGAELLTDTIKEIEAGVVEMKPQDENIASYFGYPTEQDAKINWGNDAICIRNLIRGLNPRPGAWTLFNGSTLRIWQATIIIDESSSSPGTIIQCSKDKLVVATATNDLVIDKMSVDEALPTQAHNVVNQMGINCGDRFADQ